MNKKLIRQIASVLVIMLFATSSAFAATVVPTDVKDTQWEKAVEALAQAGVISGDTDGLFHAENNLTRAQACIIIVKTINPPSAWVKGTATQPAIKSSFTDLRGYKWAEGYIGYAVEKGIVKGYPDGTFKPGNKVGTNEMLAMVLRAAGYTEEQIGTNWPQDYINKAKDAGVLQGIEESYPEFASKGMAAQMTFNKMADIQKSTPTEEPQGPQGTDKDTPAGIPSVKDMIYSSGKFDSATTTFNNIKIAKNATIYTYGSSKDYSKTMTFSQTKTDYRQDTVYKYKNVSTPAWYKVENEQITEMLLPMDSGFTGYVYCVVNDVLGTMNAQGESVDAVETLTATKAITWLGEKGEKAPTLTAGDGTVYELEMKNGQFRDVATAGSGQGKMFKELTNGNWEAVNTTKDNVVETATTGLIAMKSNASVYVWEEKDKEYRPGTLSSIYQAKSIRAYDVSDDDDVSADIIVVK